MSEATTTAPPTLHVCVTCRAGRGADEPRPGQALFDALAARIAADDAPAARLEAVECLASCAGGCAAAIADGGTVDGGAPRWTYLLGHLSPDKADDLLLFARAYGASRTGTVMPSRRPASLQDMVLGRVPGTRRSST
ncbi:DUF1636 family protein [Rhizosaccharibacter radicis]|uniref:DUF1636 domain-containing protein n=1 Tax=Rhizosaccharibacter radicis TaxID=2782605 RepID=A0ABT1VY86_9PROT|nr:DUF1636 domain-containing protein [Acetobacteraceae bacterium KSS12]